MGYLTVINQITWNNANCVSFAENESAEEDDFKIELKTSQARRTYLVTYSQADLSKFPTRQSFGEQVVAYFNAGSGKVEVGHWACCQESHDTTAGVHYHLSLKLSGPKRWKRVKEKLEDNHGVVVNFSDGRDNYYTAYRYVTKQDAEVYHSVGHPNLNEIGSPKTKNCIRAYRSARKKRSLSVDAQKKNAEKEKPGKVRRLKMSRMQLVRNARNGQCVKGCNRQWIECAHEVLKNNNIHPVVFSSALKEL